MTRISDEIAAAVNTCDREPIHIPGSIQPHGMLLALEESDYRVEQASENCLSVLGAGSAGVCGRRIEEIFGEKNGPRLRAALGNAATVENNPEYLTSLQIGDQPYQALAHRREGILILELESAASTGSIGFSQVYGLVTRFMSDLAPAVSTEEMSSVAAREVRRITGFDRVLIYRFDADLNGTVIAEDRNEELPSYLGLRFPASDIPAQARELYRLNRLRMIPDADYVPSRIEPAVNPRTGRPLDLTFSTLRSVSPVHAQYMQNMGTAASMSVSILRHGKLWGLISCHNKLPRHASFEVRSACDIIAQLLSSQLAATDHRAEADSRILLKSNQTRLLAYMAEEEDFLDGPRRHPEALLACANADGAAILYKDECHLFGTTPPDAVVRDLARWIEGRIGPNDVFHTDSLPSLYPPGESFSAQACGVIAASISSLHNSYVMWFRPELQRTVKWGGDPRKPGAAGGDQRLSPRNSFDLWKETVRFRSRPWTKGEVSSAAELRQAIVRIVLRRAEELAQLTEELQRSNQELEAFSYSVSHDLRAPFRHIVGFAELLLERESSEMSETGKRYIRTIVESAHFAGTLVDNLLSFSQIGRATIHPTEVDTAKLVAEVLKTAEENGDTAGRQIEWRVEELPSVCADLFMLRLVFQNLVSNAIKYTRNRERAVIGIKARREAGATVFQVNDNGVGFDPQYAGKLFGIFQRLHKMEDFEGTGIGLANVRRIVTRHGGQTWAEGTPDRGASFYFSIPDIQ